MPLQNLALGQVFSYTWAPYLLKCVNEGKRFDDSIASYFNNGILIAHMSVSDWLEVDSTRFQILNEDPVIHMRETVRKCCLGLQMALPSPCLAHLCENNSPHHALHIYVRD